MADEVCKERRSSELNEIGFQKRQELYHKYVEPFYNMIYKLCINYSHSPENVEENYNEVLINFYLRIETYDPSKPIRTWLHIVTKRQVAELERKRQRQGKRNDDQDIDEYESEESSDNQESQLSSNSMDIDNYREFYSDDILAVLDMMKPIHREALLLQEAGYSLKEIANYEYEKGMLKSLNIETVKSRLFLARQFLKKYLDRDGKRKDN